MLQKGDQLSAAGTLAFCGAFLVLAVFGLILCFEAGAWLVGLVMTALGGRMAYGVLAAAGLAGQPGRWVQRQRHAAGVRRYAGTPRSAAPTDVQVIGARRAAPAPQRGGPRRAEPRPDVKSRQRPRARASAR